MAELGYVPNVAAQMLASGLTYNVGLFSTVNHTRSFERTILYANSSTITSEAKLNDFTVSIATGMTVDELEEQVKLMYRQKRVDGFIILYSDPEDPVRKYLMDNNVPFVIVGAPEGFENDITYIDNDNQLMGKKAVEYLYQKDIVRFYLLRMILKSEVSSERYFGYLRGMEKLGLTIDKALLFDRRDPMIMEALIEKIESSKATALIVIADTISVRLVQFLSYYQLKVPDDISIITFNNSAYSTLIHPYMTTFDINVANLGRTSFRRLVELIKSPETAITEKSLFLLP